MSVPIRQEGDLLDARRCSRELATALGFDSTSLSLITTAVSELARNILFYAGTGEITVSSATRIGSRGITVVAHDDGPGIPDLELAMQDGYSTGGGLGLGLAGTRRLMDDFMLVSEPGHGTTVTATKWARSA